MGKSAELYIMTSAVEKAAVMMVRDYGELEKLQASNKGCENFVSSSCRIALEKIRRILTAARSDYVFSEKLPSIENGVFSWIVDPINGSWNFMRSIPYFGITIALTEGEKVLVGITLDVLRGDCYKTDIGGGAFIHRHRLRISGRREMQNAVIATNQSFDKDAELKLQGVLLRKTGSVALDLAYFSAGKYDAVIAAGVEFSEIATGILLIKESGGFVDYNQTADKKYNLIAASSFALLQNLEKIVS